MLNRHKTLLIVVASPQDTLFGYHQELNMSIIEHVSYQLNDDATEQQLAAANEQVNAFLQQQPGFIYRSNSEHAENGAEKATQFDIVYWQTRAQAQQAAEAFMHSSAGQALMALCQPGSVTMFHMPTRSETWGIAE